MEMNCLEQHVRQRVAENFGGRTMTIGRAANLTRAHQGRGRCLYRNRCIRGCPFAGYFSSNSSTLPAAYATGNLTLRPYSIVHQIIYDEGKDRAAGVRIIDSETNETIEYFASVIFCCASAVASTSILLNSTSSRFPNGMGNESGELGHNLMDHHFRVGATGRYDGFADGYYKGHRPNGIYIPRFRNVDKASTRTDYVRGFGYQGSASRETWTRGLRQLEMMGGAHKADLIEPGPWRFGIGSWGEMLPYHENKMLLNYQKRDKWGLPTVTFDCEFKGNEHAMRKDMMQSAVDMLEASGMTDISPFDNGSAPGLCIHEMGTARMGRDPKSSVLNAWNQVHDCSNVFVTDGAAMTSSACVNPSLTYMALTARACDHAVSEMKMGHL
jgi:choline dehydrogenase-like flavoprotein